MQGLGGPACRWRAARTRVSGAPNHVGECHGLLAGSRAYESAFLDAASRRASTSSPSASATSSGPRFSLTCATVLAPVMTEETLGQAPRDGELCRRAADLIRQSDDLCRHPARSFVLDHIGEPLDAWHVGPARCRDAVEILARQDAKGEWAPRREPDAKLAAHRRQEPLNSIPMQLRLSSASSTPMCLSQNSFGASGEPWQSGSSVSAPPG